MYSENYRCLVVNGFAPNSAPRLNSRDVKGIGIEAALLREREADSLEYAPMARLLSLYKKEGKEETNLKKIIRREIFRRNSEGIFERRRFN